MKIFFSFLCILMLASCGSENKNRTSNTDTNNTNTGGSQSGAVDNGPANTAFGVFIFNMPQNAKLAALKNIGALYTRLSLRADKPDEISDAYSKLYQQGYKIFLNVQWGSVKQEDGSQEAQ
ncbi:MAG TPA: hypothetical protein PL045_13880, partial [Chitinophagaceae bacterium]|nr:hypothetical protein [Chitinophagaceae bacterium]